jgi:hypothetical protein
MISGMPIYESDEHEILSERTLLFDHGVKVSKGSLYLTNKRIIYVRNGRRGIFRAAPSLVDMEVKLDSLEDVGKAVPRLNMGKKRIVSIRFYQGASLQIKDFSVSNPELWERDIRQWATEYKRRISEENRRNIEDEKKRELELAKAKAPTANIGYMYYGKGEGGNKRHKQADAAKIPGTETGEKVEKNSEGELIEICEECGSAIPPGSKFCPECGKAVSHK